MLLCSLVGYGAVYKFFKVSSFIASKLSRGITTPLLFKNIQDYASIMLF